MKCFITGISGQLGYDVCLELKKRGITEILCPDWIELDITDENKIKDYIIKNKPDVVFHCAAYTAVDKAEEEQDKCHDINVNGTKYISEATKQIGAKLIYISSDYVFSGDKDGIYEVNDLTSPVNYYGYTKYMGEQETLKNPKHFIVRTSWVYGINGKNFLKTMLTLSETKTELSIVSDQIGSPTYTKDLAKLLVDMSLTEKYGIYHGTNEGYCSWNEFAKYIFKINNIDIKINDVLTKNYKTPAKRPLNSRLSKQALVDNGFKLLPSWENATDRYNNELKSKKLVKENK